MDRGVVQPPTMSRDGGVPSAPIADASRVVDQFAPAPTDMGLAQPADAGPMIEPDFGLDCDDRLPERNFVPGQLEPGSKIQTLQLVATRAIAEDIGCDVVGRNQGSGIAGFLNAIGGGVENVRADDNGVEMDVLHFEGWREGRSLSEAEGLLFLSRGVDIGGEADELSLVDEIAYNYDCPNVTGDFFNVFEILPDSRFNPFRMVMVNSRLRMEVVPEGRGFRGAGTLTGYVEVVNIIESVARFQATCEREDPPFICDQLADVVRGDPDQFVYGTLLPIMGGADAYIGAAGRAEECVDDCNAVSVCAEVRSTPITVVLR